MRAVTCEAPGIRFRADLADPDPRPDEVLVRVRLAGICDTDLQLARGYMGFRGVLGHEFVGTDPAGRRVVAEINNACGACEWCRGDQPGHCPTRSVTGILGHDGGMADLASVPSRNLHFLPDAIDDRCAVFVEPLAAAFRVAEQVDLTRAGPVAVLGDGKLGMLCAWVGRDAGADVTLIGKHPAKLALAGPGLRTVTVEESTDWRNRFGVVIEATGSGLALADALRLARPRGTVVLKTTIAGEHAVALAPVVIDELAVIGSRCGPFPEAIAALAAGRIDVRPLIGQEFPLEAAETAFAAAARPGARKILLRIDPRAAELPG